MIFYIFTIFSTLLCFVFFLSNIYFKFKEKFQRKNNLEIHPKVSILIPINRFSDNLENNIKKIYNLNYPNYEVIFGVESINSDYTELILELREKNPLINTQIVKIGKNRKGNPKIDILKRLTSFSSGDLFWILDSNVYLKSYSLKELVRNYVESNSKLVFSIVKGGGSRTIGSIMENMYLNFFVAGGTFISWNIFKKPVITGKSILVEKKALNNIGGFGKLSGYLSEDYLIGKIFENKGYKVTTNNQYIINYNSSTSMKNFIQRFTRWAKLRFNLNPYVYSLEILTNPIILSLILSFFIFSNIYILVFPILFKVILDMILFIILEENSNLKITRILILPFIFIIKDIVLFFIYLLPYFNSKIRWDDKFIRIGKNTKITERSLS